ncbi:phytoene desaturase family protein [Zhihengliuella salsuginis]|uniref:Phytoene desaturase n=1 Tax=Zhihengliuella salsuginis TaxID=578222 RepID=A0ABQ3GFT3_9MICC|nr:phytoene desaturase family protein [Zhihengliuella salsuginis]GHD04778.1 phytoene desaturase [Zhihengliuella salsuginis]
MSGRAVVIGGGFSGLATAGLLARDGHPVTLLEQREDLGGRSGRWSAGGFHFDTGPSWYLMPEVIDRWFRLMGTSAAHELELTRLDPAYRVWFGADSDPVDVRSGREHALALFEQLEPGSSARAARYLDSAADTYDLATRRFLYDGFASPRGLLRPEVLAKLPQLLRLLTTSLHGGASRAFRDERIHQLLGYPAVFLGTTPYRAPGLYQLMSHLDLNDGVLYPRGGFAALVDAMERVVRDAGVEIRTGATVTGIETRAAATRGRQRSRVEAVAFRGHDGANRRLAAETVVAAADLHHVQRNLLRPADRDRSEARLKRTDPGPGAVLLCAGIDGELPELAHHNLLFTPDWRDNFARISGGRALQPETSIYASRTSATDPTAAPAGQENLFILVPSPAQPKRGHGAGDRGGDPAVEAVADRALDQVGRWSGVLDLASRVVVRKTWGPGDFAHQFNAFRGSALGPAHTLAQSAFFRPGNQSRRVGGLFFAGASVRPGIGVPMCMISAEIVLKAVRGDTSGDPVGLEPVVGVRP